MGSLSHLNKATTAKTSKVIRQEFLNYFSKDLGHTFIQSSPVQPFNDKSIAFVNAGMNQFKGIFLDLCKAPAPKIVNFQKCIRVGGKHNDLVLVGNDTSHLTFFEMLGNWSFNDYFKREACEYAWNLLTGPYEINKECLFVTYFGGDKSHNLPPDLECRDIWLNIGLPENRIIPSDMKNNFWEMGPVGPCGPCTEIHIDRNLYFTQYGQTNETNMDLIELWNLVFMQYKRIEDGSIIPLSKHHIDTGMGFERLVSLLQRKKSIYDIDIFQPLFAEIQKCTGAPKYKGTFQNNGNNIDYGYRILADHSRMITVALADNVLPEKNHKLRRIIRKAIDTSENIFKQGGLLQELACIVADDLADVYPELHTNLSQVNMVLQFEIELKKRLQGASFHKWKKLIELRPELEIVSDNLAPGLSQAYMFIQDKLPTMQNNNVLSGDVAFKLYDTYGLNLQTIVELAKVESLKFDEIAFEEEMSKTRYRSKIGFDRYTARKLIVKFNDKCIPKTCDALKYKYTVDRETYEFPIIKSQVLAVIINDNVIFEDVHQELSNMLLKKTSKATIGIILDKTAFYSTEGGQVHDKGYIYTKDYTLIIDKVEKVEGYVIHYGELDAPNFKVLKSLNMLDLQNSNNCTVCIDKHVRVGAMRHHTATHLLNAALKQILPVHHQASSTIYNDSLKFTFNTYGRKLKSVEVARIEDLINDLIGKDVAVITKVIDSFHLINHNDITLTPGEIYPYNNIRIIEIDSGDFKSREACCGTHVHKTGFLENFCILSVTSKGASLCGIKALAGSEAVKANKESEAILSQILNMKTFAHAVKNCNEISYLCSKIDDIGKSVKNKELLPYLKRETIILEIEKLKKYLKDQETAINRRNLIIDITKTIQSNTAPFIVYKIETNTFLSVEELVKLNSNVPILLISYTKTTVKAQTYVPQEIVSSEFSAENWLKIVEDFFDAKKENIQGFDSSIISSTKPTKYKRNQLTDLQFSLEEASQKAIKFAEFYLNRIK
ncbi:alanine--tRNA ligase, mitochondrial [Prorops nasuta]|uniref:alanine--tRNA ligase, mitochondrial n=1 Tax=Prorops nasuta TaxID=863751 RepID=UPI0034CD4E7C